MPADAIYVGRPTRFGNPFKVGSTVEDEQHHGLVIDQSLAVALYSRLCSEREWWADIIRRELRGRDLVCWCAPGVPCHADVLLEVANS